MGFRCEGEIRRVSQKIEPIKRIQKGTTQNMVQTRAQKALQAQKILHWRKEEEQYRQRLRAYVHAPPTKSADDATTILLGAPPNERLSFSDLASQLWGIHIERLLTQVQEGTIDQEDLTDAEYKACYIAMTQGI